MDYSSASGIKKNELLEQFSNRFVSSMVLKINLEELSTLKYMGGSILNYLDKMEGLAHKGNWRDKLKIHF